MKTEKNAPNSVSQSLDVTTRTLTTEEIEVQVRLEYARYIEKRDAVRKENGRLRRSLLREQLAS